MKKILSLLLALMMLLASVCMLASCNDTEDESSSSQSESQSSTGDGRIYTTDTTLGNGATTFTLVVEHIDGTKINFTIKTDKAILSDALVEVGVLEGHEDTYGLFIDKVNGVAQLWEVDQTYWAIYEGESYATTGIDGITIVAGATYKLVATKG